jgi:3-hydroxyacyl-CoA dehydrogenase
MINEASLCLAENVVEKPEEVDVAMIFGAGFPPFTGGLLRYADKIGTDHIVNTLDKLADTVDERFRPSDYLRKLASNGKGFFS